MIQAFAATTPKGPLQPFEFKPNPLGSDEVDIAVDHCGICHSDISMLKNEWGLTSYPFVPGHEIIGTISAIGNAVSHLKTGQHVGLGWHAAYCLTCDECLEGHHNLCATSEPTIIGRHGGFADTVRAQAASVALLPEELNAREAGPLLCGGMAVYNPLVQMNVSPNAHVAVIGIGGLGHLALKFSRAWGCEVTAFTSSSSKAEEALSLGAHHTINSRDDDAIKNAAGSFDLILSTVNVPLDWNNYLATLKPRGRMHMLGAVTQPLELNLIPMMFSQLSLSSSPVGSPATIRKMLNFAARHEITPTTEHFSMNDVNDAIEHLESGNARYRIILDRN
ncbi:MAG: NAD(P)-dependent alcohol dehydrogenase [Verrucomicrobiota bacterium]